ncbi:hypothetical protein [Clostridium tertium]|uniref:hypothetical protein n=1 Tax=Clostridium tertium TaxID=1559 RepID=UPI0023B31DDB|nr:hypothetical protein [Clostridium tertium]
MARTLDNKLKSKTATTRSNDRSSSTIVKRNIKRQGSRKSLEYRNNIDEEVKESETPHAMDSSNENPRGRKKLEVGKNIGKTNKKLDKESTKNNKKNLKSPSSKDKAKKKKKELNKTKLDKNLAKENDELLDTIGDRDDVISISSEKLSKLMGDDSSRRSLIKKYGKTRLKFEMYLDKLIYFISKGGKVRKTGTVNKDSFQIMVDRIYTFDKVIKIWAVELAPELVDSDFEFKLRKSFIEKFPNCELLIKEVELPYYINFESDDILYHLEYWAKQASNMALDEMETKDDFVKTLVESTAKYKRNNVNKRMISSFYKIKNYQMQQHRFYSTYKFLYVYAPTDAHMEACSTFIKDMHYNYTITLIKDILPQFLKTFGSAYLRDYPMAMRSIKPQILADLDSAELTPYEQGAIGSVGICVGIDLETNLPVNVSTTGDAKGKTILIAGPTGEGKSAEAKGIAHFHKINKDRIVFMDYEGHEYDHFIKKFGGYKVSQSITSSTCVNTLVLGDCRNVSQEEATRRLNRSRTATAFQFKILYADSIEEMDSSDLNRLIDEATDHMYRKVNVVLSDKQTYHNADNLIYQDLYESLETLWKDPESTKKYGNLLDTALNRLHPYWSSEGSKRYLFENPVSFDKIFEAEILQLSLGMAEQKENTTDVKDTRLKYFNVEYILTEYVNYNRKIDKFTAVFIEELQRAASDPILLRLYNHLITGGRKLNLVNYVLTNSVLGLFQSDNKDAMAIKENINILLIGPLTPAARESIIKEFSLEDIRGQIEAVATDPVYDFGFVLTYKIRKVRQTAIVKMSLPDEILKNPIFKTRTVKESY